MLFILVIDQAHGKLDWSDRIKQEGQAFPLDQAGLIQKYTPVRVVGVIFSGYSAGLKKQMHMQKNERKKRIRKIFL